MNYVEILKHDPEIMILDGSLVDVAGTLLQGFALNKPLYAAMEEAHSRGEKIYIYSGGCDFGELAALGVDFQKFPFIDKLSLLNVRLMVLGKIIDDTPTYLMMSDEDNYIHPRQTEYHFSTNPVPKGLPNKLFR